ncbi:4a-hydroxytetrahydrobiopterin dehydratase [Paracoccus siganidrum]|uniref:Putative pterin-4-alpha-carbinolamine dehydratase n=1 Tax=Paracoccus siganidrum TaxID=1276757 RepID=A0A419A5Y8_9RHOB|nr:4a-hydroxytetrahydrobiopterin dehydratase [Paracoccus siganidrum]RJL13670.1 4a-hydroxytetrahydrobiopterin dehydratase [Paracoccus siganidrum]RMC33451.1 4a-hydroxytetrahydrobiopterin dehydratase [Paracoccus siganidrum]
MTTDLASQSCEPCKGGVDPMSRDEAQALMEQLQGWVLSDDGTTIRRRFEFKGFAKAVEMANLAAWLGNKQGHHPDIAFGWGYCEVAFTTHEAKGLTQNDFICAARLDALVA